MLLDFPDQLWHGFPISIAARLIQKLDVLRSLGRIVLYRRTTLELIAHREGSSAGHLHSFWETVMIQTG